MRLDTRTWIARGFIGLVLFFNIQSALVFLAFPDQYSMGFQLSGVIGSGVVRGYGLLFLMWNVPYMIAFTHPIHRRVSLYEAVLMQSIGLVGETILLATFPDGYPGIQQTISRFIFFDGFGFLALVIAAWMTRRTPTSELAV